VNRAGRVPAARYRSRGRHRPGGVGRGASAERSGSRDLGDAASGPARIAAIRTSGGLASSAGRRVAGHHDIEAGGELRLIVLEDGRRFRVDAEEVARLGLEPGLVLAPPMLVVLEARDAYRRARETALRLLGARPRSIAELRARLRRAGVPLESSATVITDLTRDGYLDDLEFARAWVRNRLAVRPCGALRLRSELRQKGVAPPLIEQAIREGCGEEEAAVAEERRARDLAERRLRAYARLAWDVRVRRLAGLLQRRGFAAPTIARVLRTVQRSDRGEISDA
jgi:regulatory protein